ncbi:MAG: hypothetical protein KGL39_02685 [Patescibacteria group bacterium]|nr:hypothetical protein [Patescibacteria group bacterium]
MILTFAEDGAGTCLYSDLIPLQELGRLSVRRASYVIFNHDSQEWEVRHADYRTPFSLMERVVLFHSPSRQLCLDWEEVNFQALL